MDDVPEYVLRGEVRNKGRGVVEKGEAEGMYRVTYTTRAGKVYDLGLFNTLEESFRVCDVLTIKEAVDVEQDLRQIDLHFALGRYGVDNDTAGEIAEVSFERVAQDLQQCAEPSIHTTGHELYAEDGARSVGQPAGTSATEYHDAEEGKRSAGAVSMGRAASMGCAPLGLRGGGLPSGPVRSMRTAMTGARTVVTGGPNSSMHGGPGAAFQAGGTAGPADETGLQKRWQQRTVARRQAVAGTVANEGKGGEVSSLQQMRPQPRAARGVETEYRPPPESKPRRLSRGQRHAPSAARRQQGSPPPARRQGAASDIEEEESEESKEADEAVAESEGEEARGSERGFGRGRGRGHSGGLGGRGWGRGRGGGRGGGHGSRGEEEAGAAAAADAQVPAAVRAQAPVAAAPVPLPAPDRAMSGPEVLRVWYEVHTWCGLKRPQHEPATSNRMFALVQFNVDELGNPDAKGARQKNVRLPTCDTPAEAAVAFDLGRIWRAYQLGTDPVDIQRARIPSHRFNFPYERYAGHLAEMQGLATIADLQTRLQELRDGGMLAALATGAGAGGTGGPAGGAGDGGGGATYSPDLSSAKGTTLTRRKLPAPAGEAEQQEQEQQKLGRQPAAETASEEEEQEEASEGQAAREEGEDDGVGEESAAKQHKGAGRVYAGVYKQGRTYSAQVTFAHAASVVLPAQTFPCRASPGCGSTAKAHARHTRHLSVHRRPTINVRVTLLPSVEMGAVVADLAAIWRCLLYNDDLSLLPSNFNMSAYAGLVAPIRACSSVDDFQEFVLPGRAGKRAASWLLTPAAPPLPHVATPSPTPRVPQADGRLDALVESAMRLPPPQQRRKVRHMTKQRKPDTNGGVAALSAVSPAKRQRSPAAAPSPAKRARPAAASPAAASAATRGSDGDEGGAGPAAPAQQRDVPAPAPAPQRHAQAPVPQQRAPAASQRGGAPSAAWQQHKRPRRELAALLASDFAAGAEGERERRRPRLPFALPSSGVGPGAVGAAAAMVAAATLASMEEAPPSLVPRRDEAHVAALEAMFRELCGWVWGTPGVSEEAVARFLACWTHSRDSRRLEYLTLRDYHRNGRPELLRAHVLQSLATLEGGASASRARSGGEE
eukprot:scaffold12.g8181.t1